MNMVFAILAIGSAAALLWQSLAGRGVSRISPTQASVLIAARAQIIDVRPVEAFAAGHIKNAKSLPLSLIEQQLPLLKLKKDKPVILVCERGVSAARAVAVLAKNEFTEVHVLDGGLNAWRDAQMPLVKG
ncbi:MAG: rhodanese-like domain-containing protein [Formosimonas sp.]